MAESTQRKQRSAKRRPKRRPGRKRGEDDLVEFEEILAEQDASFDAAPEEPTVSPDDTPAPSTDAAPAKEPDAPAPEKDPEEAEAERQAAIDAAVEERLSAISQGSESNKAAIDAVSEKLEGVMDGMSALRQLSEAISYRYNPFLDDKEGPMPGGKRPGAEVVKPGPDGTMVAEPVAPTPSKDEPEAEANEPETKEEPVAKPAVKRPARPKAQAPKPEAEPADAPKTVPAKESKPEPKPAPPAPEAKEPQSRPTRAPAESAPVAAPSFHLEGEVQRRSAIALQWFGHLCKDTDPAAVFVFLDHYHALGWLADDDHAWLTQMAHGLARPRANATWRTFKLPADRLVVLHQNSLRVIAALIHPGPDDTEAARARRAIDRIMEAD